MNKSTIFQVGTILILLTATAFYFQLGEEGVLKIRFDDDQTSFLMKEDWYWKTMGVEKIKVYDGTKLLYRDRVGIQRLLEIDNETKTITAVRITPYKRGPVVKETYVFDGNSLDVLDFPVSHEVEVFNATNKIIQYEVRRLEYSGDTIKDVTSPQRFGKMMVEWEDGNYWSTLYKSGILKVRYRAGSDYESYSVRLVDPPVAIIDPTSTGFGSDTRYENMQTLREAWNRNGNVTFMGQLSSGANVMIVPWFSRGDQCDLSQQGANALHACQNTASPFSNGELDANTFCVVTDEASQVMIIDSMLENNTVMEAWLNTIEAVDCGGNSLAEWTTGWQKSGGTWSVSCDQVSDTASDADAHFIAGLANINASPYANSSVKTRAGEIAQTMCSDLVDHNFLSVSMDNTIRGGALTRLPCGGTNVCTNPTNNGFMYMGYNGPILEALAGCHRMFGDNSTHNFSRDADQLIQAHLQASNWTGSAFSIGDGRHYKWSSSTGPAHAICTHSGGTCAGDDAEGQSWMDNPDGMRAPRICQGAWVWENYRNISFDNITTYCQQWADLAGETGTSHVVERYFDGKARSASTDGGYLAMGLGMPMKSLANTTEATAMLDQYNTHIGGCPDCVFDSQACMGVYDKAFGMINGLILMNTSYGVMGETGSSPPGGGGGSESGTINITVITPLNASSQNGTSVLFNVSFINDNVTSESGSSGWSVVADYNFTSSAEGWTLGTGWAHDDTNDMIYYDGGDFGQDLFSPDLSLTDYPLGYNITLVYSTLNITNWKLHYMTDTGELDNCKFHLERSGTSNQVVKRDCDDFSNSGTYAWGTEQTVRMHVNQTANTTKACVDGVGCTSVGDALLTDLGDYFGIDSGSSTSTGDSRIFNLSRVTVHAVTEGEVAGNSSMNVTYYWLNGTEIASQDGVENGSHFSYNQTGMSNGTYRWYVNAVSANNNISLENLSFMLGGTDENLATLCVNITEIIFRANISRGTINVNANTYTEANIIPVNTTACGYTFALNNSDGISQTAFIAYSNNTNPNITITANGSIINNSQNATFNIGTGITAYINFSMNITNIPLTRAVWSLITNVTT